MHSRQVQTVVERFFEDDVTIKNVETIQGTYCSLQVLCPDILLEPTFTFIMAEGLEPVIRA